MSLHKSKTAPKCPNCDTPVHIYYVDAARQLGNWDTHDTPAGNRCPRSGKKALASKYRGL